MNRFQRVRAFETSFVAILQTHGRPNASTRVKNARHAVKVSPGQETINALGHKRQRRGRAVKLLTMRRASADRARL